MYLSIRVFTVDQLGYRLNSEYKSKILSIALNNFGDDNNFG